MKFNFLKRKKNTVDTVLQSPAESADLPEIYRGVQIYESESDRFCTFDEDYFAGESYGRKTKKGIRISDPRTPPSFFAGILFGAVSVLLLSGGIAFFSLFSKLGGIYRPITVPDLTSLTESEAIALISKDYDCFDYSIEYKDNPLTDQGTVISQIPKPSTMRKLYGINGRICIKLTVSGSSEEITLPDIIGQEARDVSLELKNSGINVVASESYSDSVGIGRIIASSHPVGSKLKKNDTIYITSSLGKRISYLTVPSLVEKSESEALAILRDIGLEISKVIYKDSDLPLGTVIEQSIEPKSSVREKSKITLTVSKGISNE